MTSALRRRVYAILENYPPTSRTGRLVDLVLIAFIVANVLINILDSVEWMHRGHDFHLLAFEHLTGAVFTIEYIARIWSAVESPDRRFWRPLVGRLRFALTPMLLIDLIAILPFWLMFLIPEVDLFFLRVFRLLRIFKLTRYSPAMNMLLNVFRKQGRIFSAAAFILFILMVVAASGMYLFEHRIQPETFGSIPAAMWWAVSTLTTVGYGDVTPVTPMGKLFGALVMLVGVGMVAMPAGLLASAFIEEVRERREEYEEEVEEALEDGRLTAEEAETLDQVRARLGLSQRDATFILEEAMRHPPGVCPHCGRPLGPAGHDE